MTDKPYADIRKALVDGIRNNPEKSDSLKHAAEIWIACIDNIEKSGADEANTEAFRQAHVHFIRTANGQPFPEILSPAEIAKAFGLEPKGDA